MLGSTLTYDPDEVCFSHVKSKGNGSCRAWQIMLWLCPCLNIINALFGTSPNCLGSWAEMKRTMTIVLNLSQNEPVTTDFAERRRTFIAHCYIHNPPITPKKKQVPSCPYNNKLLLIHLNEKQVRPETCNFLRSFETLSSQENLLESPTQSAKWETHI